MDPHPSSTPVERPTSRQRWIRALIVVLLLAAGARVMHRSPRDASALVITPDELMYGIGAQRLATAGRFDLEVDGKRVPTSVTPWFSAAVLAPVYWFDSDAIGTGVYGVLAWSLVGLLAIYAIGSAIGGPWCAAFGGVALLAFSSYPYLAGALLTDAPAAAVSFGALWLFVRGHDRPLHARDALAAGVLIAIAVAFRSVYLALLVPFAARIVRRGATRLRALAALALPSVLVGVATAVYHHATFGDWRRTGFQYWMSVPYDYPELVLSFEHVAENLALFTYPDGISGLSLGAIGALCVAWRGGVAGRSYLAAVGTVAALTSGFLLLYFYGDLRLHLFTTASGAALGGMGIGAVLPGFVRRSEPALALVLAVAAVTLPRAPLPSRERLIVAEWIFTHTPPDAIVISGIEPVYFEALEPGSSRRTYVAATREVEFASKLLVPIRVDGPEPPPRDAFDHRCEGLRRGGAREAIAFTADERPDLVAQWLREKRPVFFDRLTLTDPAAIARILSGQYVLAVDHRSDVLAHAVPAR